MGKISTGEFSDLFSSISLLVGGNYKITPGIMASAGTVFLQRKNENPAITDPKTSYLNPYFAVSFELDFIGSIQKLTDKLF